MGKTILAIGGNSTFASAVLPFLAQNNKIITAGRHDCDIYCDINDDVVIPEGVDVVVNFAADFGGPTDQEINAAVQTNVFGALKVCETAKAAGVTHVINISSIFALLSAGDPNYSIYALTKRQADELISFYCRCNDLALTILRPSRVYGDSDIFAKGQPFFYEILDKARQGATITLYGSKDTRRNYIHISDLAEILARVINDKVVGVYNCTFPVDDTYSSVVAAAQKVYGKGGDISRLRDKPNIPDDMVIEDTSLYEKINYWPATSIEAGIRRYARGEKI